MRNLLYSCRHARLVRFPAKLCVLGDLCVKALTAETPISCYSDQLQWVSQLRLALSLVPVRFFRTEVKTPCKTHSL